MRWGYKTVQYGLKKEGLLGGSFLDEAEVEQSLNELGQAGWELVSLFGMDDGLMAVFKQPIEVMTGLEPTKLVVSQPEMAMASVPPESFSEKPATPPRFSLNKLDTASDTDRPVARKIGRREPAVSVVAEEEQEEGVGSIRIE
jgi:hypothetical protein